MIVDDMPETVYHARPELSSSQARLLLESPAKYQWSLNQPPVVRDVFDIGTAVHTKVLGVGAKIQVLDFPDFRSVAARKARDDARSAGFVPLLEKDAALIDAMAEGVLANKTARALLELPSRRELSVFSAPDGVECRARLDAVVEAKQGLIAVDLKTTPDDASPAGFAKSTVNYGYHVQAAHYTDVWNASEDTEFEAFLFIVVEKQAPYLTAVHQLDPQFRLMGSEAAKKARDLHAECSESGVWPGHPDDVQIVGAPTWAVYQHEEKFA